MSEIKLKTPDNDLIPLLRTCDSEQLDNLVAFITRKGGVSSQLENTAIYRKYHPDHCQYADEIAAEIQKYGGNTLFNIIRGGKGVGYQSIAYDVAGKLKLKLDKNLEIEAIEREILLKILEKSWEKMGDAEKKELLLGIMDDIQPEMLAGKFPTKLVQAAVITGSGLVSYKLSLIVANAIGRTLLQKGVSFAANAGLARWATVFAGAVGWGVTALWALFDIAGPAYRVTVPCVIHIAMLRQLHLLNAESAEQKTGI